MDIMDAIAQRHSVRSYTDKPIASDVWAELDKLIATTNKTSELHSQLHFSMVLDDPTAFDSVMAHYGHFHNVHNYIICAGEKSPTLEHDVGYYGENIVLKAQMLGLNTCWVGLNFGRNAVLRRVAPTDRLICVIALGYGETQGASHPVKPVSELSRVIGPEPPEWFKNGMWAAQLAPTNMNQQRFLITYEGGVCSLKSLGGFYSEVDLGVVKRHFEIGAGRENVAWR